MTNRRTMDYMDEFRFHELCGHSQAELKIKKFQILEKKWSGDMVNRYLCPKFDVSSNDVCGWMTDEWTKNDDE